MRPAAHRYDPRLRPVGHRQARTPLWIPLWLPALLVILGAPLVVLAVFPASGVPGRLSLPPAVHATPGARPSVSEGVVPGESPVDQADGQQRGDDPASRSTPRPVPTSTGIADPPLAPAAGNPPDPTPNPLLLPVPTSPPLMAVPSPSLTPGPTCDQKPPHGKKSPRPQLVDVVGRSASALPR
jgi:hypothetical protein